MEKRRDGAQVAADRRSARGLPALAARLALVAFVIGFGLHAATAAFAAPPRATGHSWPLWVRTLASVVSGTITPDGPSVTTTISNPGDTGQLTFSGTAGERVFWKFTNITFGSGCFMTVNVDFYDPHGSEIGSKHWLCTDGDFLDTITLPSTGTYSLVITPASPTGSITSTLYDVPADVSGSIAVAGETKTVTITTPGQNANLSFSGQAGQPVKLVTSNNTIAPSCNQGLAGYIKNPDGSTLVGPTALCVNGDAVSATLPTSGIYSLVLDPYKWYTGSVTINPTQSAFESPQQTYGDCDGGIDALNQSECLGDIDAASGAYSTSATDVSLPGIGVPFSFVRSYTSADPTVGPLGPGWTDNYAESVAVQPDGDLILHGEDGQEITFAKQDDGSFVNPAALGTLTSAGGGYSYVRQDQTHLTFDSQGRLTSITDRNGKGVTLAYGGSGHLASAIDGSGRQISFSSNADGTLSKVTLPDGRHVDFGYTGGLLTSVTDMRGNTTSYGYDTSNRLTSITDQNNHRVVQNTYGSDGRLASQLDAMNNQTTYSWDASSQTETVTDARNNAWKDVYANGVLVKRIDPLGDTIQYQYDGNNNLTAITDARGNVTTMSYDAQHNMTSRIAPSPLSYAESWTYDSLNDVLTYTDGRGKETSYGYDANGNRTSMTQPGDVVTQYGYDPAGTGLLISTTDARNKTTSYGYDNAGDLTSITTALGNKTCFGYDSSGRITSKVDPRGNVSGASPAD